MIKKIILLASIIGASLSSCTSTYFYSTLQTTNYDIEKVENGDFLYQNDSLWIAHCFKGEDAPIQITVFNKLNVPLYVDWARSALILNSVAHSYSDGESHVSTSSESQTYHNPYWGTSNTYTNTDVTIQLPQHVDMIPPKTMVSRSALRLAAQFDEINKKEYTNTKLGLNNDMTANAGFIKYNLTNTPLSFGSYITVYEKPEKPQYYTTDFYVSNLIKTKAKPNQLPADMAERGDTFYQQKRPNNTGWKILGATTIVAGAIAVEVMAYSEDY